MSQTHAPKDIQKLGDLIADIKMAMLTTIDVDGNLRSRPMATQETRFDGNLWFFTKEHSPKMSELMREAHVNVSYSDPDGQRYVSISGTAELVNDMTKKAALWSDWYKAWFPDGLEDPELALLRVSVTKAEYWDTPSSKMMHLFGAAKAMVTGKEYEPGDHGTIELH